MNKKSEFIVWLIMVLVLAISSVIFGINLEKIKHERYQKEISTIQDGDIIKLEQPEFYLKSPQDGLMEALEYFDVPHKEIVYAQAILETGYFHSNNCVNKNNLFGIYDSKNKTYKSFPHWVKGVEYYKKVISSKYTEPNEDYYLFLEKINYSMDSEYTNKLKSIVKQNLWKK